MFESLALKRPPELRKSLARPSCNSEGTLDPCGEPTLGATALAKRWHPGQPSLPNREPRVCCSS